MTQLLRIDASSRLDGSHSRALGDHFENRWMAQYPAGEIVNRDLVSEPIDQIQQSTIAGFYTPVEQMTAELNAATALSNQLITELQSADALLISTPMYNFSVPSSLKAWIDQIVRIGHTFSFDGQSFNGLVKPNRAFVICAYGANGYLNDGAFREANFLESYLDFLLGFLGIKDVHFISIESTTADEATVNAGLAKARTEINTLLV